MSTSPFGILTAVELWVSLMHTILVRLVAWVCFGGASSLSICAPENVVFKFRRCRSEAFRGAEEVFRALLS